jgi:hypothetical protein
MNMAEKFPIDRYNFLEVQVKYYMQCLLVETPEQVVQYLKKRLKMYSAMLVTSVQHLIQEYSLDILRVKEYMNYQKDNEFLIIQLYKQSLQ